MSVSDTIEKEAKQTQVELGPLFTAGALLVALGLLRRRKLAVAAGLAAIVLDQRSKLGRDLKELFKAPASPS